VLHILFTKIIIKQNKTDLFIYIIFLSHQVTFRDESASRNNSDDGVSSDKWLEKSPSSCSQTSLTSVCGRLTGTPCLGILLLCWSVLRNINSICLTLNFLLIINGIHIFSCSKHEYSVYGKGNFSFINLLMTAFRKISICISCWSISYPIFVSRSAVIDIHAHVKLTSIEALRGVACVLFSTVWYDLVG
jgi:hypothetical protein